MNTSSSTSRSVALAPSPPGTDSDQAGDHASGKGCLMRGLHLFETHVPYQTHRVIKVRDWRLTSLNLIIKFLVFVYIVVYKLMYKCSHLVRVPVQGAGRMSIQ